MSADSSSSSLERAKDVFTVLGLEADAAGVLRVPVDAVITFVPIKYKIWQLYELKIALGGTVLTAVVPETAFKICRERVKP